MPKADKRPGILLYFDLLDALEEYELSERAEFIYALRDYAVNGIVPDFEDRGLRGLWKTTRPNIDRDGEKYEEKVKKARYSAYVGAAKRKNTEFLSFEDWSFELERSVADGSDRSRSVADGSQNNNKLQYQDELQPQNELHIQHQLQPQNENEPENEYEWQGKGYKGEGGKLNGGIENPDVFSTDALALHEQYVQAMNAGNKAEACTLSNKLYALGYHVDIATGKMNRRKQ